MKHFIPLLILMLTHLTNAFSQTYDQLWKEEAQAAQKDLPKTQIAVLDRIAAKAAKEKAYGQLLASTLKEASLQIIVAPDSLQPAIDRLTDRAAEAEGRDEALAAVYNTVLGHIFTSNTALGDGHEEQGKAYYQKALAHPDILGRTKAGGFVPLLTDGKDAAIFSDDLLNVIAREVGDWATLATYYKKVGNREAACYASLMAKSEERGVKNEKFNSSSSAKKTNSSLFTLYSSLVEEYADLPICGEVAIALYNKMDAATPKERYDFCTEAISRWGTWPRIDVLRNAQLHLTAAMLQQKTPHEVIAPGTPQTVGLRVRNIRQATFTITRLNVTGDTQLDPGGSKDLATLRSKAISGTQQTVSRTYSGHAAYDIIEDSLEIPALTTGVYLLEFSTNDSSVKPLRSLYRVTSVFPLYQHQPDQTMRIAVVDFQSGQPIPHAKVKLLPYTRYSKTVEGRILTTDSKGELILAKDKDFDPRTLWAHTEADKASPTAAMWGSYSYYKPDSRDELGRLYTDRQIYRPGQTVHVAVIAYEREGIETKAIKERDIEMTLLDANYKAVATQTVRTDEFGTASADFTLPTDGLTGRFTISADNFGQTSIQVEEYKRPTFEVEIPEVTEAYHEGDTLTVEGIARTYAGVPVQNAKVSYTINRREALWWWRGTGNTDEQLAQEETTTDHDGHFTVRIPLLFPEDDEENTSHFTLHTSHFYNFVVSANVTDQGGESHEGSLSIPLGTKPTAFSIDMADKFLTDSAKTFRLNYRNAAGKPIDATVRLAIDGGQKFTVKANETIDLEAQLRTHPKENSSLFTLHSSLKHTLVAICGTDTLTHDFIVFSLNDKKPVVETHDWFYISANEFPAKSRPVYVQVGSTDPDQHILYSVFSGKRLLESGAIDQSCALTTREFTYKEEYGDGILVTFAWVKDGKAYTHAETIRRPMPDKHLKLTWKTFRDRLTPGQDEEWTLAIARPNASANSLGESQSRASLMATLYDKSLDQLSRHSWDFSPQLSIDTPYTSWEALTIPLNESFESTIAPYKSLRTSALAFRSLRTYYYENLLYGFRYQYARASGPLRMMRSAKFNMAKADFAEAESPRVMVVAAKEELAESAMGIDNGLQEMVVTTDRSERLENVEPQLRENLTETAFFYPQLTSDTDGQVAIKFRLPESVTTWRFLGLAHDKDMNYGLIDAEAVAKKEVMVVPNVPRFVRQGDQATLTARILNTTDHAVSGNARLELVKATALAELSETSEYSEEQPFTLPAGEGWGGATFHLPATLAPDLYIVRITATGDGFSDGEQHYLPVLTNKEYVTTTRPFYSGERREEREERNEGVGMSRLSNSTNVNNLQSSSLSPLPSPLSSFIIDAGELFPTGTTQRRLTVEYTENPEWLAIQALPYMSVPDGDNAISLATAYFANTLGRAILTSHPSIRQAIELWQREQGDDKSLMSALEKNQELKSLVLKETPWVAEADAEREQRQRLIRFFDENTLQNNLTTIEQKLQKLQNPDGSFSWWQGMEGSPYMTMSVVKTLVRLGALIEERGERKEEREKARLSNSSNGNNQLSYSLSPLLSPLSSLAFSYLDKVAAERVREMKEWEKKGHKDIFPSDLLCDYAYASALAGRKATAAILYIVGKMEAAKSVLSIYGKANTAVILHLYGRNNCANDHLRSLKEYSVYKEEMGRYFDTPKANYSWFDYRMPTQVAAIEALRALTPADRQTITEMQRWLLQEKRTTMWNTPLNCVEAVYALESEERRVKNEEFNTPSSNVANSVPSFFKGAKGGLSITSADGTVLAEKQASEIATLKASVAIAPNDHPSVKIHAAENSWGAIYAQYLQDIKEVKSASSGLTVKREILSDGKALADGKPLKVGDRIRVRITIRADRDYDFVQVVDKRAACLEPVEQTSGYRYGCYIAPKDQETRYYFDRMAKGTHTIDTEYYVDREGQYQSGTCTAQCAYAPEFTGRAGGTNLSVGATK